MLVPAANFSQITCKVTTNMLLFTNLEPEARMAVRLFLFLALVLSILGGCGSSKMPAAEQARWDADQAVTRRSDAAIRAQDYEQATDIYESLWHEATQPNPPRGIFGSYSTLTYMIQLTRIRPECTPRFIALEAPLAELIQNGIATPSQCQAWENIVTMMNLADHNASVAESLRANPSVRKSLELTMYARTSLMAQLRLSGREDLATVYSPGPGQAIFGGAGDIAAGAAGIIAAPVLGPLLAPK